MRRYLRGREGNEGAAGAHGVLGNVTTPLVGDVEESEIGSQYRPERRGSRCFWSAEDNGRGVVIEDLAKLDCVSSKARKIQRIVRMDGKRSSISIQRKGGVGLLTESDPLSRFEANATRNGLPPPPLGM